MQEEVIITRHGKPAGVLIGFGSEDDWFDYRLEHDPAFRRRIELARASLRRGKASDSRMSVIEDPFRGAIRAPIGSVRTCPGS